MKIDDLFRGSEEEQSSLAVRITVVVFWGMVGLGLLGAVWLTRDMEQGAKQQREAATAHVLDELRKLLHDTHLASPERLMAALQYDITGLGLDAMTIALPRGPVTIGKRQTDSTGTPHLVAYTPPGQASAPLTVEVTIYSRPFDSVLDKQRRQALAAFGGVLLLFGFAFHKVMRRLVTRPFQEMIDQAKSITAGTTDQRFSEARTDEFGFLARFMNRALHQVTEQSEQLRSALAKAYTSEQALFAEKERIEVTLHSIADAVITTDAAGRIQFINPAAEQLFDAAPGDIIGQPIEKVLQLQQDTGRAAVPNPVQQCLSSGKAVEPTTHVILALSNGKEMDVSCTAAPIHNRDGQVVGAVIVLHDISHNTRMARALSHQASHDALTGLANRVAFESRLTDLLESIDSGPRGHAVAYLDMDQFKIVNDTCGHAAGDELLRQFSQLLRTHVRDSDVVARLGGDEFGLLLINCDAPHAQTITQNILNHIREFRFGWQDQHFNVGASIGLVHVIPGHDSISSVMQAADVACYAAKDGGRNRLNVYNPDDSELRQRHADMHWVTRIDRALTENRFRLYAQPVVPLHGHAGHLEYAEILVRFVDENGQLALPGIFIPAAERYSLMHRVDRWVFDEVCRIMNEQAGTHGDVRFGINLSAQTLSDKEFLSHVLHQIDTLHLDPGRLCFEITETAAISNLGLASQFISTLREKGCLFALDDFGSGLSSFSYLKKLRVDYLKIDGEFIKDVVNDPIDRATVAAIHQIGTAMGIPTVAEYVENDAILAALMDLGVSFVQGFGIARPVPAEQF
ncbi:MAG: EAL domain-containing protein, partial [Gammaproteobacteria bacterium]|nr:EAL domain-containing protein [Gammaproteobacteria bacterium]